MIGSLEGVNQVKVNPLTGSVLLYFEGDLSKIMEKARQGHLFELQDEMTVSGPWSLSFLEEVEKLDQKIKQATDGVFDLPNSAAVIFIGLGTLQALRREILPVASTLFLYAANLLMISKNGNAKSVKSKLKSTLA